MALKREKLKEGWVEYTRSHCKTGHIDRWMGDCINDPNNNTNHNLQLNSMVTYWRCNNGKWIHGGEIGGSKVIPLLEYGTEFTAQEIWDELIRIEAVSRL